MKIAIVHYHLRRGGVTQVIKSAVDALKNTGDELLVISGEKPEDDTQLGNLVIVPGLNYRKTACMSAADGLVDALKDAAINHFGSLPDVWHFHNHSLGKNVLMPLTVTSLAEEQCKVLLQLHDFPEDGRPKNYVAQRNFYDLEKEFDRTLYPRGSHIHYATINRRDQGFLKAAGMKSDNLHYLPNSVTPFESTTHPGNRPFSKGKKFIFYPTRGIRRKNLGEMLLLALAYGNDYDFATSLEPENPEWLSYHDQWKQLAAELELPIRFGIGIDSQYSFGEMVGWSDAILTTSIAEGFGLAFLEPWLMNKVVVGRNLPRITEDFSEAGIDLSHLYERIDIPMEWVDEQKLRTEAESILRGIYLAYDTVMPKNAIDLTFSRWIENDCVDFGMLSEEYQIEIIKMLAANPDKFSQIKLPKFDQLDTSCVAANRDRVAEMFSAENYCAQLQAIYKKLDKSSCGRVKKIHPDKVLAQFLDPWRFNLLRT